MILPLAFLIDWIIGDPAWLYQRRGWSLPHPIVLIGRLAAWVEKRLNHGTAKGVQGLSPAGFWSLDLPLA